MQVNLLNNTFILFAEKAAYWKEKNILIISDLHLGKTAHFRNNGAAIPGGTTDEDLKRLTRIIENTRPDELIILGDFFHSKTGLTERTIESYQIWRNRHSNLAISVVKGNHDKTIEKYSDKLNVEVKKDMFSIEPFTFNHKPIQVKKEYVICGHVHPAVTLRGKGKQREILCCFYFGDDLAILPSFGGFTGNYLLKPVSKDRVYAIVDNQILNLTENYF